MGASGCGFGLSLGWLPGLCFPPLPRLRTLGERPTRPARPEDLGGDAEEPGDGAAVGRSVVRRVGGVCFSPGGEVMRFFVITSAVQLLYDVVWFGVYVGVFGFFLFLLLQSFMVLLGLADGQVVLDTARVCVCV